MSKNIDIIRNQITRLDEENFEINSWLSVTDNFLKSIWGHNTPKSKQLYNVCNTMSVALLGANENDIMTFKNQWKTLLNSYIEELENIGIPETIKESASNFNLTINQTQHQDQSQIQKIEIEKIISALKNELTGNQLKELEAIIKDTGEKDKVKKLSDKLLSFGSSVLAGILSNILSNPQITGLQ